MKTTSWKKAICRLAMNRLLWLFLLLGVFRAPALAQPSVGAALSQNEILIGDQVTLTVVASYGPPVEVKGIGYDVLNREPRLEVLRAERFEKEGENGVRITEVEITLTCFDSGYYFIPPIPIAYEQKGRPDTIRTNELALKVNTLPVATDSMQIQPIKGIIEEPVNLRDFLPYLIGLIALILLVALFFYFRRRKQPPPPPPPPRKVPAHELALEQLDALARRKLWQQGAIKEYHSELTRILREYLEQRYDIIALERTTGEIIEQLRPKLGMDETTKAQLRELLQTVDLVKFAKAQPPATFHGQAMDSVVEFVKRTRREELLVEAPEIQGDHEKRDEENT